jgi:hypothetical protein
MKFKTVIVALIIVTLVHSAPQKLSDHMETLKNIYNIVSETVKTLGNDAVDDTGKSMKNFGNDAVNSAVASHTAALDAVIKLVKRVEKQNSG